MGDWIALGIILLVVIVAVTYLIRAKKKGVKCIGCPDGCGTSKNNGESPCSCCCGCGGAEDSDTTSSNT